MLVALRRFPDVATVAALLVVVDLADAAVRASHPTYLGIVPTETRSQRRALIVLRSLHRLRRDAVRYVEHHADLVGYVETPRDVRQIELF